jgi:hypothetical protein
VHFLVPEQVKVRPYHWLLAVLVVAVGDYLTGPFFHSAILFYLIPVAMAAWSGRSRWPSLAMAILWPFLRLGIIDLWGWPWPIWATVEDSVLDALLSAGFAVLIWQLRHQGQTIRTLEGLLPMCGFCKRIRTPEGWERVETYILDHSEAQITHTFCPECGRIHYGHLFDETPPRRGGSPPGPPPPPE